MPASPPLDPALPTHSSSRQGVFVWELSCKIIAYGLVYTPDAYLRNKWNAFDAAVVSASLAAFATGESGVSVLRTLRLLRLLRLVPQFSYVIAM